MEREKKTMLIFRQHPYIPETATTSVARWHLGVEVNGAPGVFDNVSQESLNVHVAVHPSLTPECSYPGRCCDPLAHRICTPIVNLLLAS